MEKLTTAVREVEGLGDQLLSVKAQLVELDRTHHANRMGLAAIAKRPATGPPVAWLARPGGVLMRFEESDATGTLTKEQRALEAKREGLLQEQKRLVARLRDTGGAPDSVTQRMISDFINLKA